MRAYNVLWARAKVAQEIEDLINQSSQRVLDIQDRIKKEHVRQGTAPTK